MIATFMIVRGILPSRIRAVVPGKVYRSGQPSARDLERAKHMSIRTVVNLRGNNEGRKWYDDEIATCQRLGLAHADLRLETFSWPPRREAVALLDLLESGSGPLLLHCSGGSDRSGWAAGVARAAFGEPLDRAEAELSKLKGHICDRATCPLHRFFTAYRERIAGRSKAHDAAEFASFVRKDYCPPGYDAEVTLTAPFPRTAPPGSRLPLRARVTNHSGTAWVFRSDLARGIRFAVRRIGPSSTPPPLDAELFRPSRGGSVDVGRAGIADFRMDPDDSGDFEVTVEAPAAPGHYLLQIDMVDEGVSWFSDLGREGVFLPFEVRCK